MLNMEALYAESQLHVLIVGAGIGGLAAATALGKAGHKVQVCTHTANLQSLF